MIEKNTVISSSIEARDIALIVQTASQFTSEIKIVLDNKIVNAKSIMGLIALGNLDGKEITVQATGTDESLALGGLIEFLSKG